MPERDKVKRNFTKVGIFLLISFIETGALLLFLFVLERAGIFIITVVGVDGWLIYSAEAGGFFFLLILMGNIVGEVVRYFVAGRAYDPPCCDDVSCLADDLPMCANMKKFR